MSETNHTPFREAIMRAWVCGWYAGRMGETSDDGKRVAAECIARDFPAEDSASSLRAALAAERERVRVLREALEKELCFISMELTLVRGHATPQQIADLERRSGMLRRALASAETSRQGLLDNSAATEPTP